MRWLVPFVLVCAAGCHQATPAPTCDQVAAHLFGVITSAVTAHTGMTAPTKEVMAEQCRTSAYSDEVRRCLAGVTQTAQIPACRKLQPGAPGASTRSGSAR